jgi:hypothetical protein
LHNIEKYIFFSKLSIVIDEEKRFNWVRPVVSTRRKIYIYIYICVYICIVYKLFSSNQNYIRFYKLLCCDCICHEEAYRKIIPHLTFLRSAGTVSPDTTALPFCRLLRLVGNTVEVFLPVSTWGRKRYGHGVYAGILKQYEHMQCQCVHGTLKSKCTLV